MAAESFDMIAKTLFGLEGVLVNELAELGAEHVEPGRRLARFRGDLKLMYAANVHCRTAVRVLKPIHVFDAPEPRALYERIGQVDWLEYLDADGSLAIDPVVHGTTFGNSLYVAQLAKDAIVDQIRDRAGRRPRVDLERPHLRINLHIDEQRVTVYLDSSGDSLHKRGYRVAAGEAPMSEVLAAGILALTGWDRASPLSDFACGSGTLLIEAALAARQIAPGLVRGEFGFMHWPNYCRATHDSVLHEARERALPRLEFALQGSDLDGRAIAAARQNAAGAGVGEDIRWLVANFDAVKPPADHGTLVTNPPYDVRMKAARISAVYRRIGDALKRNWAGHTAFVFTGSGEAAKSIGLRSQARIKLFNGPIECRLLRFDLQARADAGDARPVRGRTEDQAQDFTNRLARMARHWRRWARRQEITCFRVYDRDIPDVPLSIDCYEERLLVREHDRPHGRTDVEQSRWLQRMVALAAETLGVDNKLVTLQACAKPAEPRQAGQPVVIEAREAALRFEVRLGSSPETGLALDQRSLRALVREHSSGKRVLNLFARSGTATVAAAAGGALSTVGVEASRALADWAQRNLRLNGLAGHQHRVLCADPLQFVEQLEFAPHEAFDLAIVCPPGFDGKRRPGIWNVQDGHVELIERLLARMSVGGRIYFVTTFRRLALRTDEIRGATIREITRQTVPADFRNKKVHRSWLIVRTSDTDPSTLSEPG